MKPENPIPWSDDDPSSAPPFNLYSMSFPKEHQEVVPVFKKVAEFGSSQDLLFVKDAVNKYEKLVERVSKLELELQGWKICAETQKGLAEYWKGAHSSCDYDRKLLITNPE